MNNNQSSFAQISRLKNIQEVKAAFGNQAKMLKLLTFRIIDRDFISMFNWTGKSASGDPKEPFKNLTNITMLLHGILTILDSNYSYEAFEDNLKKKILKHAKGFEKKKKNLNEVVHGDDHMKQGLQTMIRSNQYDHLLQRPSGSSVTIDSNHRWEDHHAQNDYRYH